MTTDKQMNTHSVTASAIHDAMFSSLEGCVLAVVDSLEFALSRELSSSEHQYVYDTVKGVITRQTDSAEVNHG
ncbi:hypothetical protein [Salmonella enterica]|uniref:Uncharacterized protein n=2 Tax=Salmonella enterica TaxID=28901 RepID=A0A379QHJ4_SALER|nr:hypothetical protein [Salmonella enterica]ECC1658027.1 hypothetical protein [Salmonella enterica subsp. salamae]ASG86796.1 hypothetical protein LFZ47_03925 [Salmonella enterica subsp. salamae serovar 55:k:z39 str. 1315K]ECD9415903.1 hypothetical protein [Salmonella enterica subsp. salamae]ECF5932761.1 hypothetical protein [Salmonella enterica subsp. salamae]ECG1251673.1 hypothetical protein [Salmonella enterica subsp. salamae]